MKILCVDVCVWLSLCLLQQFIHRGADLLSAHLWLCDCILVTLSTYITYLYVSACIQALIITWTKDQIKVTWINEDHDMLLKALRGGPLCLDSHYRMTYYYLPIWPLAHTYTHHQCPGTRTRASMTSKGKNVFVKTTHHRALVCVYSYRCVYDYTCLGGCLCIHAFGVHNGARSAILHTFLSMWEQKYEY